MQIRNRLSLYFTIVSSCLMLVVMACIYLLFANAGRNDFYRELHERTEVAAGVYLEADEITPAALEKIRKKFIISLPHEVIRFYDSSNRSAFIDDNTLNWDSTTIGRVRAEKYLEYKDGPRQVVGISYEDNQGTFVILASAIDVEGRERRLWLINIMLVLFAAQLLIQFLAGRWLAKNMLLPIQKVNGQVQKITATDLHLRVDEGNGKDEISTLASNFNQLLERLEHSFDLQRMFVANASHELKTPLTSMIGEMEVILNIDRSKADYKTALQSALTEAERLHTIISNFLLLANAENGLARQHTEQVRIDELLWEMQAHFLQAGFTLIVQMDDMPDEEALLCLQANKTLLQLALSNIIRNGFKFSAGKPVRCCLQATGAGIRIAVTDEGIGIAPEALVNIFEPFYRSSKAQRYEGHGIGLYVAAKIVSLYGGRIQVSSKEGAGSTFNILFS